MKTNQGQSLGLITRKLNANQRRMIKQLDISEKFRMVTNKKGKSSLILTYPKALGDELMKLMMCSLISLTIQKPIFKYRPIMCIKAFLFIGCTRLLDMYAQEMKYMKISTRALVHCFALIVQQYPFSSNHSIIQTLFEIFDNKGIPHDFIQSHMIHDNKLDTARLVSKIAELHDQWSNFWKYKSVKECIYCQIRLTTLKPITRRLETIREMDCCGLVCCSSCYNKLSLQQLIQCKACDTHLEFNKQTRKFDIEKDLDDLHSSCERNYFNKIQNHKLTGRQNLPWPQPGSSEYGELVRHNQTHIQQNYRMSRITTKSSVPLD